MSFSMSVDMGELDALLVEMGDLCEGAARPAAQAAAQVLYDAVRENVRRLGGVTGNLYSSIYQAYSKDGSGPGKALYHVSWNSRKAPHGGLVESGHIQRYATYMGTDGRFYTAIRPSMRGKRRPGRRASQSEKDAYYVTLPVPRQVAAKAFVRNAETSFPAAVDAARDVLLKALE
jgi:hypothetical protein